MEFPNGHSKMSAAIYTVWEALIISAVKVIQKYQVIMLLLNNV